MVKLGIAGGAAASGVELLCWLDLVKKAAGVASIRGECAISGFTGARA